MAPGLSSALVLAAFTLAAPVIGSAQTVVATTAVPDFQLQVWGDPVTSFTTRVNGYSDLRARLESHLPPVTITHDTRQIRRGQRSLAKAIRLARPGAMQGEFFTTGAGAEFKQALGVVMTAPICAVIMDDNPGAFRHRIDGTYPEGKTLSTMPGVVLARLPRLPDDIEFRFLGRHLILHDVRANTIIDRLPFAIVAAGCDD